MTTEQANTRVAIITGGAGGIGQAVARRMIRDGHRLALLDIDGDAAARAAEDINREAGTNSVLAVAANVADAAECEIAVGRVAGLKVPAQGRGPRSRGDGRRPARYEPSAWNTWSEQPVSRISIVSSP